MSIFSNLVNDSTLFSHDVSLTVHIARRAATTRYDLFKLLISARLPLLARFDRNFARVAHRENRFDDDFVTIVHRDHAPLLVSLHAFLCEQLLTRNHLGHVIVCEYFDISTLDRATPVGADDHDSILRLNDTALITSDHTLAFNVGMGTTEPCYFI